MFWFPIYGLWTVNVFLTKKKPVEHTGKWCYLTQWHLTSRSHEMDFILLSDCGCMPGMSIHPSVIYTSLSCAGSQRAGAFPNSHCVRGMVHQFKTGYQCSTGLTYMDTHIYTYRFINVTCMCWNCGIFQDLLACEVMLQITVPPCRPCDKDFINWVPVVACSCLEIIAWKSKTSMTQFCL